MEKLYSCRSLPNSKLSFLLFSVLLFPAVTLKAQTAITTASSTYAAATTGTNYVANGAAGSPLSGNSYTYTYGNQSGSSNNNLRLNSFVAGGITYSHFIISNSLVFMRRVNNGSITGVRNLKYEEGNLTGSNVNTVADYDDDMESFFNNNKEFNAGTDNLFANTADGNGNVNNIERVDAIFPSGISAADHSKIGFGLFERGATGAHDPAKVALVLSIDGANNPTSYSAILTINAASYGGADVVASKEYVIARRDNASESNLRISTTLNQPIGGVFFKFSDFGVANNTPIYGYSIFAEDFTGTPAEALDYTNPTFFPITTDGTTGDGGIDLVAYTGVAQELASLPVTLVSFTAQKVNDNAILQWTTASEQNSHFFEIQRSADGVNYIRISEMAAAGNSVTEQHYQYADNIKPLTAKLIYYRIKMANIDNSFTYSGSALIKNNNNKTQLKIYPQPLAAQTYIDVAKADYFSMKLFTAGGMLIQDWNRIFISPLQPVTIYNKKMTAGTYYLQLRNINTGVVQVAKVVLL
jgi:hypothetical protein